MASFAELRDRVFAHYFKGQYREALKLIEDLDPADRSQHEDLHFWRMCLLSRLGETDHALATFRAALDRGHWWSETMLRDSDLDPLRELPEWETLLERCRDLEAKTPPPQPDPVVVPPAATGSRDGRALVVLHGAGSRPELETEHWKAATEAGWTTSPPNRPSDSRRRDGTDGTISSGRRPTS